jgi:hypothetical protein
MGNEVKKEGDQSGSFVFLNNLIITFEEGELKLEEAYKKNNPEQVKVMKEYLLKLQKKIEEETI